MQYRIDIERILEMPIRRFRIILEEMQKEQKRQMKLFELDKERIVTFR